MPSQMISCLLRPPVADQLKADDHFLLKIFREEQVAFLPEVVESTLSLIGSEARHRETAVELV